MSARVCVCVCMHVYVCVYVCMCVYVCVCVCVCVYVCVYVAPAPLAAIVICIRGSTVTVVEVGLLCCYKSVKVLV
jgi:hypothetical protein